MGASWLVYRASADQRPAKFSIGLLTTKLYLATLVYSMAVENAFADVSPARFLIRTPYQQRLLYRPGFRVLVQSLGSPCAEFFLTDPNVIV